MTSSTTQMVQAHEELLDTQSSHARDLSTFAIRISNVSKMYRIYEKPQDRLKQMVFGRGGKTYGQEFWALHNLSFELQRGETFGVIGRNGSGKSTLLQIIAGTLTPTTGTVEIKGRVAALLELGSGFNLEFTGRENVYMNGAILGFSREEMAARFDEITAFADIGSFIDQPAKLYSSGMLIRLAFAVQACVDPDILIVDEALAVGDVFFQQKCYRRLEQLRQQGTSVLLVSHGLNDIRQYCQHALVLDHGEVRFAGPATDAVAHYMLMQQSSPTEQRRTTPTDAGTTEAVPPMHKAVRNQSTRIGWPETADAFLDIAHVPQVGEGKARCSAVALLDKHGNPSQIFEQGETLSLMYEFEIFDDIAVPVGGFNIENEKGILVHGRNALQYENSPSAPTVARGSFLHFRHDVKLDIAVGEYTFEIGLATLPVADFLRRNKYSSPELYDKVTRLCHLNPVGRFIVVPVPTETVSQMLYFGVADLEGKYQVELCG